MPCNDDGDKPFNPFYIGPHPSKACATAEPPGQKCSPCSPSSGQQKQAAGANTEPTTTGAGAGGPGTSAVGSGPAVGGANDDPTCQLNKPVSANESGTTSLTHENNHGVAGGIGAGAGIGASMAGSSNVAGGLLIVGMAGPTGGVATIYSTGQIPIGSAMPTNALAPSNDPAQPMQAAQAKKPTKDDSQSQQKQQQQQGEQKPCRTYPCMERSGQRDGGC
ncbi:uncharacterized protein Dwil_GK16109 [Drosophila willistoni]|uniref:Uncharacterized protein n=1 Tax=Drosophila willistoni TaxID=7260 RepID=B4N2J6_DROWI|nr:uncharacterized protein Dwil_GK16109 [Drosophila willistoni]